MIADEEYRKIGKAVVDECIIRGDEECISITLRSVQFDEKLYIRMEDQVEPISIWNRHKLLEVTHANETQAARERVERHYKKLIAKMDEKRLPKVAE